MTPQEISDYKQRWMSENNNPVSIHSDYDVTGKDWCRHRLERHQWSFQSFTNVNEHTFFFENKQDAIDFAKEFKNSNKFEIESLDPAERSWYYDGTGMMRKKE